MIGVPEGCCTKNIGVPRVLIFATFLKRHVEIGREYPRAGGGGGVGLCRLVLPRVHARTCAPFGGNPALVDGWAGGPLVGLGMKRAGSERLQKGGSQSVYLTARGESIVTA